MTCSRGAATPNAQTQRRLYAASAGYCQNPGCSNGLFSDEGGKCVTIAELAHIFAASDDGPRGNAKLTKAQRGSFENIIVLCANCHTKIDKAPEAYPDTTILGWKYDHARKLEVLFGATKMGSRAEVRQAIEPLLAQNRAIFNQYGPHIEAALNPESGAAEQWKRKMLSLIIPNSHRLLAILGTNRHLANESERTTLEQFRQHVDDLVAFHIEGSRENASRFPAEFLTIMEE